MNTCKSVSKQSTLTPFVMYHFRKTPGGEPHSDPSQNRAPRAPCSRPQQLVFFLCTHALYPKETPASVPPLIAAQGLSKSFGVSPLFQNLSFTVSEGERIGLVGPNGSGKSTLLEMLFGRIQPDSGDMAIRKRTRISFVAQISTYEPGATIRRVLEQALDRAETPQSERLA